MKDITVDSEHVWFSVRAVAVFVDDGHVLLQQEGGGHLWNLPGGRVRIGEKSEDTLRREILEELGEEIAVSHLQWVAERRFTYCGRLYHEIGFYFMARFISPGRYDKSCAFRGRDDGDVDLTCRWFPISQIDDVPDVVPAFLYDELKQLPCGLKHLV